MKKKSFQKKKYNDWIKPFSKSKWTGLLALYFTIDRFFDIHRILFGDSTEIQTTIFHLILLALSKYMKFYSASWISVPIVAFLG